ALSVTPAAGPVIDTAAAVLLSTIAPPVRVMVWAVVNVPGSKEMAWSPTGAALAKATASRRLIRPGPARRASLVVFTARAANAWPVLVRANEAGEPGLAVTTV